MPSEFIDFDDLRRAVEAAHGQREQDLELCRVEKSGARRSGAVRLLTKTQKADLLADDWKVTPLARTKKRRENTKRKDEVRTKVSIAIAGGKNTHKLTGDKADAAFWTESAIEKFMLPYYQRTLSPAAFQLLADAYYVEDTADPILAFIHYPTSDYDDLRESDAPVAAPMTEAEAARADAFGELAQLGVITASGPRSLQAHVEEMAER